jgi:hypothetical protein
MATSFGNDLWQESPQHEKGNVASELQAVEDQAQAATHQEDAE